MSMSDEGVPVFVGLIISAVIIGAMVFAALLVAVFLMPTV
jgi:hypothetical protein